MDTSKLIDELVRDEGLRLKPYKDSMGILTIGIGRNLEDNGITAEEAYHLCRNDILGVEADLDHACRPWWRHLDEVRQRVLANMCFNMGIDRLSKFHFMLAALAVGDWKKAAAEMKSSAWYGQVGVRAVRLETAMLTGAMP